jgi:hypothetical protein
MADLQPLLPRKIPQSVFAPIAPDTASLPPMQSAPGVLGAIAPPTPNVINNPRMVADSSDPLVNRASALSADLYKRENPTKPTTTLGKIGHVAAGIGNVLGDIFAPSTMELIPGTQLQNERIEARDKSDLNQVSDLQNQEATRAQTAATTAYTQQRPAIEEAKVQQRLQAAHNRVTEAYAHNGQTPEFDEDGNVIGVHDDPTLLAHAAQQAKADLQSAQTDLANSKNDPTSPAYQQAERRVAVARANAIAAQTRANAYMGNYNQHAFNKDNQGNVLPGAPQITDENGNVTVPGTGNAATAIKSNANAAQFGDVAGATGNIEDTAKALVSSGGRLNSPGVVYALQNTHGTPSQVIQSVDKANLTPEERAYVISNIAFKENLQALRKSAGGSFSDSAVDRLEQLAPNGSTPDLPYLLGQTGQIRQTYSRLGKGVATATGGLKIPDEHSGGAAKVKKFNLATGRLE